MKDYLFDIGNRLKVKSQQLDASAMLCNKTWRVYSDSAEKELYIFMTDGSLIISNNGTVDMGKWLYIPANQSLVITSSTSNVLVHPILVNKLLILVTDGTERCSFLIDSTEKELDYVSNLTLFTNYIDKNLSESLFVEPSTPRVSRTTAYDVSELLYTWTDKTKELIVDNRPFRCGCSHYIMMNQIVRYGSGFEGKYYYQGVQLPDKPDDTLHIYYAIPSTELQNGGRGFIFDAQFDKYDTRYGEWRGLFSLRYKKDIKTDDYDRIWLSRWYDFDLHEGTLFRKRYWDNPKPAWSSEFFPTNKWNDDHNCNNLNIIISISEWMDKFGDVFWADVDRYNEELTSFLGMSVYVFFESDKWRR